MNLMLGAAVALLTLAVAVGITIYRKPELLWTIVVVSAIIGVGPKIMGYALLDEAVLGGATLGAVLRTLIHGGTSRNNCSIRRVHWCLFAACMIFFAYKSVEGIVYLGDWRIFRFYVYFSCLCAVSINLLTVGTGFPSPERLVTLVLVTTTATFSAMLVQGLAAEYLFGYLGRFSTQGLHWSGSAYAMFPLVVAMPIALQAFAQRPFLAAAFLAVATATVLYFNSRVGLAILVSFAFIGIKPRIWGHFLALGVLAMLPFAVFDSHIVSLVIERGLAHLSALVESAQFLILPRESDTDRQLALLASAHAAWQDPLTLFFGQGIYAHRVSMLPSLNFLSTIEHSFPVRTTGMAALIVDTGIMGVLLLSANFVLVAIEALRRGWKRDVRSLFVFTLILVFTFGWLFVANIVDIVLLFLLIMPGGLLLQLQAAGLGRGGTGTGFSRAATGVEHGG